MTLLGNVETGAQLEGRFEHDDRQVCLSSVLAHEERRARSDSPSFPRLPGGPADSQVSVSSEACLTKSATPTRV